MPLSSEAGSLVPETSSQAMSGPAQAGVGGRETTVQLIESVGLRAEEHRVETDDGYILTLHRIVAEDRGSGIQRPVIFLQHGLLGASSDWCIGARDKALSFLLVDAGYDVWLGNFRGNTYSKLHKVMSPKQKEFWIWSFDHMGQQDLPAMISHVLSLTGQKQLTFIGHSMGTMAFWVMMNARPWMNASVKLMVGLAPIAAVTLHRASPLHICVPVAEKIESMLNFIGQFEFASRESILTDIKETSFNKVTGSLTMISLLTGSWVTGSLITGSLIIGSLTIGSLILGIWILWLMITGSWMMGSLITTHQVYSLITGSPLASGLTKDIYLKIAPQADLKLLPTVMRHFPAGTSSRNLLHFGQGVRAGEGGGHFLPFAFRTVRENFQVYGRDQPEPYSLKEVTCPVLLYWGEGDWLSQPRGVARVAEQLPNLVDSLRVPHEKWNHFDFLWGRDADKLLYTPLLQTIATFMGH